MLLENKSFFNMMEKIRIIEAIFDKFGILKFINADITATITVMKGTILILNELYGVVSENILKERIDSDIQKET